ncbi:MAG: hypothetical protein ACRDSR_24625 [Pseudonocardiaceae bacterium]
MLPYPTIPDPASINPNVTFHVTPTGHAEFVTHPAPTSPELEPGTAT